MRSGSDRGTCRPGRTRSGSAAPMEAVMATAITLPVAASLFWLGLDALRSLYDIVSFFVGWPFM